MLGIIRLYKRISICFVVWILLKKADYYRKQYNRGGNINLINKKQRLALKKIAFLAKKYNLQKYTLWVAERYSFAITLKYNPRYRDCFEYFKKDCRYITTILVKKYTTCGYSYYDCVPELKRKTDVME